MIYKKGVLKNTPAEMTFLVKLQGGSLELY